MPLDVLLCLIAITLGGATPQSSLSQQQPLRARVEFQELSFELPGSGWDRSEIERGVMFVRSDKSSHALTLAVWAVDFDPAISSWSKQQHVSAYFDMERLQARPDNVRWEKFAESERTISGAQYPTLRFHTLASGNPIAVGSEGIMLLYFPVDFQQRRAFYCLMWDQLSPTQKVTPPLDLLILDRVVSSFRVQPLGSPAK